MLHHQRKKGNSRGIALLMALFVLMFLFILALAFRVLTDQQYLFSSTVARRAELYYLAEAGVEYAIMQRAYWTTSAPPDDEKTFQLPSGQVSIEVSDSGSAFSVVSKGKFSDLPGSLCVTIIATIDSAGNITAWEIQYY